VIDTKTMASGDMLAELEKKAVEFAAFASEVALRLEAMPDGGKGLLPKAGKLLDVLKAQRLASGGVASRLRYGHEWDRIFIGPITAKWIEMPVKATMVVDGQVLGKVDLRTPGCARRTRLEQLAKAPPMSAEQVDAYLATLSSSRAENIREIMRVGGDGHGCTLRRDIDGKPRLVSNSRFDGYGQVLGETVRLVKCHDHRYTYFTDPGTPQPIEDFEPGWGSDAMHAVAMSAEVPMTIAGQATAKTRTPMTVRDVTDIIDGWVVGSRRDPDGPRLPSSGSVSYYPTTKDPDGDPTTMVLVLRLANTDPVPSDLLRVALKHEAHFEAHDRAIAAPSKP
jgi:hypothetical protein